jgi:Protein kinase domain
LIIVIRDTSIDDLTLLEICHNPDHPYRSQLEFDKKRHPRISPLQSSNKKDKPKRRKMLNKKSRLHQLGASEYGKGDSLDDEIDAEVAAEAEGELENDSKKLQAFFGEDVEVTPNRRRRRKNTTPMENRKSVLDPAPEEEIDGESKKKKKDMSKLMDFFGENLVATVANSKLADFFGENEKGAKIEDKKIKKKKVKKERLESSEAAAEEMGKESFGTSSFGSGKEVPVGGSKSKDGSKRLEAFFGDRPPQEMIAKNLEVFFPGLNALKDNDSSFQDAVKNIAENKRASKMQKIQTQMQERKRAHTSRLPLDLGFSGESIMETLDNIYGVNYKPGPSNRASQSPQINKRRPDTINFGRSSPLKLKFELLEFPEELPEFEEFNDIAALIRPGSFTKSDSVSSFRSAARISKVNEINIPSKENSTSKVEALLNLSSHSLNDMIPEMPRLYKTESTAEFFDVFEKTPDVPRSIKWIQGPLIGMGAFGKVFYGANCDTGEIMAVKQVLIKNPSLDSRIRRKMLEALHTEITLLRDLDHPNIVRYLGKS